CATRVVASQATRVAISVQLYCGSFGFTRRGRVSIVCACFFMDVPPAGVGAGLAFVGRGDALAGFGLMALSAGLTFVVAPLSTSVGAAFVPASSCSAAFSSASSSLTFATADGSTFG